MFPATAALSLGQVSDRDLVHRFVHDGDHSAFELLFWRYQRLVYGICRRVAGSSHDAEDAAQATFLILARRAKLIHGTNLAGWLARVAYRCAVRIRGKRQLHQVGEFSDAPAPETPDHDSGLTEVLDDELNRLPDKYRVPVVLCYLHGRTYDQAAAELNCPIGTLSGWLTRGKAMLRRRLHRRGVALSVGSLTAVLSGLQTRTCVANEMIRTLTRAAAAYAAGNAVPGRAAAIANGVLRMMTWKWKALPALVGSALLLLGLAAAAVDPDPPKSPPPSAPVKIVEVKKSDAEILQGVWVFESAVQGKKEALGMVWSSKLVVAGDAITVEGFLNMRTPLKGTITLDPSAEPKRFDLKLQELDLAAAGAPMKIAAGNYPGIYKWDGESVTLCWTDKVSGSRPTSFDAKDALKATLAKAPANFKEFPKTITVKAIGPDGKPVPGAIVTTYMDHRQLVSRVGLDGKEIDPSKLTDEQKALRESQDKLPSGAVRDEETGWVYYLARKTDAEGTVELSYQRAPAAVIVRDPAAKHMGIGMTSPAALLRGPVVIQLQPECKVHVTAACEELTKAGKDGEEYYNAYITAANGQRLAYMCSKTGKLDCQLPPGVYSLNVYGSELIGSRTVKVTVPKDQSDYTAPPIAVPPTGLLALIGKPAPELTDVVAWKGEAVKLADLKGKVVLVEFWGYWCGPCIQSLPVLFELHDKFKDRGVVIVGVHVDGDGEIDTVKALDEKLASYKKRVWNGRDIPFPVALTSGKIAPGGDEDNFSRGALVAKYGIRGYPSTILIDREGKVVGNRVFGRDAGDIKLAIEYLEDILKDQKK